MITKVRSEVQLIIVIGLAIVILLFISTGLTVGLQPSAVLAQNLGPTPEISFTPAPLESFGFAPDGVVALDQNDKFDLEILKTTNTISVTSGTQVTYNVKITNKGPDPAQYFYFYDVVPTELKNVMYTFPAGVEALNNGASSPETLQWLITSELPVNQSINIAVAGELTSLRTVIVRNTAVVTPFVQSADPNGDNNSSYVDVNVTGSNPALGLIYLPLIRRDPTPTPDPIKLIYQEDFNADKEIWFEKLNSNCRADHTNGIYQVDVDESDRECLPPAKEKDDDDEDDPKLRDPAVKYGEVEVEGYISGEGKDSGNAYGIWMNGRGGDTQYVFRIFPNASGCSDGGRWEFLRRKPNANATLAFDSCDSRIERGYGSSARQTIRVGHRSNGQITLYIDDILIQTINDSNQITNGEDNGVYVRADDVDTRVKFDDYKVFEYQ